MRHEEVILFCASVRGEKLDPLRANMKWDQMALNSATEVTDNGGPPGDELRFRVSVKDIVFSEQILQRAATLAVKEKRQESRRRSRH